MIGASDTPGKVGYTVLRNLKQGFPGLLVPVNSHLTAVQDLAAVKHIGEAPGPIDLAVICTPAAGVPQVVRDCGQAGVRGIVILSAGFREVGTAGRQLEQDVAAAKAEFPGMRRDRTELSGCTRPPQPLERQFRRHRPAGRQRGVRLAIGRTVYCRARLGRGRRNRLFLLRLDRQHARRRFRRPARLLRRRSADRRDRAVRRVDQCGPAVHVGRPGRRPAQADRGVQGGSLRSVGKAAASHTGAMAGVDAVLRRGLAPGRSRPSRRTGRPVRLRRAVGPASGCRPARGSPSSPMPAGRASSQPTHFWPGTARWPSCRRRCGPSSSAALPSCWSHGNPIDILGDATPERFGLANCANVLADRGVDAALVLLSPQAMTDPTGSARAVSDAAAASTKPVLAAWLGGELVQEGAQAAEAERRAHLCHARARHPRWPI